MNHTKDRQRGLLLAALGAVAFSGKAIIVKLAYRYGVDAVTLIMYRMLFALPMFVALAWWGGRGKAPLTRRDARAILGLGFSGYYLASYLDFAGLHYISASLERLITYLNPTLVLALGVLLISQAGDVSPNPGAGGELRRCLLRIRARVEPERRRCAAGCDAGVLQHRQLRGVPCLLRRGGQTPGGDPTHRPCHLRSMPDVHPQFLILRPVSAMAVAPPVIWLSLLNATVCTFAPVLMVMMAIERIGAPLAAQTGTIGPISTILMAVVILHEPFTIWITVGTALVLLGIWMLTRTRTPTPLGQGAA